MTTPHLTPQQTHRLALLSLGVILGFGSFAAVSLTTDAAVHQGVDPDIWWLWLTRVAVAVVCGAVCAVIVVRGRDIPPATPTHRAETDQ